MDPSTNITTFISELDRVNREFYQFDMAKIDEKMANTQEFIEKYKNLVPCSGNANVEKKLHTLSGIIGKFSKHNASAKRLAAEVDSLASTVFMPYEVIERIVSHSDAPTTAKLSGTAKFYQELVENNPKFFFKIILAKTTEEVIETAGTMEQEGKDQILSQMIFQFLSQSDPEKALKLVDQMQERKELCLVSIAAKIGETDPERALAILDQVTNPTGSSYTKIAERVVQKDIDLAFAIISKIEIHQEKIYGITRLIELTRDVDPEKAKQIFERGLEEVATQIDNYHRDYEIGALISSIAPIDLDLALRSINRRESTEREDRIKSLIADTLAKQDLEKALEIVDPIRDPTEKAYALKSIAAVILEKDPERAKTLLRQVLAISPQIEDQGMKDYLLEHVSSLLFEIDPEQALKIYGKIQHQHAKFCCVLTIIENLAPNNPKKALEIARTMGENFHPALINDLLTEVIHGFLAKGDPLWALLLTNKMTSPNNSLSEIAVARAKIDLEQAVEITTRIKDPAHRSKALTRIACEIAYDKPAEAKKLVMDALELTKQAKQLTQLYAKIDICGLLQKYPRFLG